MPPCATGRQFSRWLVVLDSPRRGFAVGLSRGPLLEYVERVTDQNNTESYTGTRSHSAKQTCAQDLWHSCIWAMACLQICVDVSVHVHVHARSHWLT